MHRAVERAERSGRVLGALRPFDRDTAPRRQREHQKDGLTPPRHHVQSMPQVDSTRHFREADVTLRFARTCALFVVLLGLAAAALAQSTTGSISGLVVDSSKSVLPGVTIEVR